MSPLESPRNWRQAGPCWRAVHSAATWPEPRPHVTKCKPGCVASPCDDLGALRLLSQRFSLVLADRGRSQTVPMSTPRDQA